MSSMSKILADGEHCIHMICHVAILEVVAVQCLSVKENRFIDILNLLTFLPSENMEFIIDIGRVTNEGKTTLTNRMIKNLPNCCVIHQSDFP